MPTSTNPGEGDILLPKSAISQKSMLASTQINRPRHILLVARALAALVFLSLPPNTAIAEDVMLSEAQARDLGVRIAHPVPSPTDQTLPYPAQIVIPTPQLWVVSAPVAGMVTNLAVARERRQMLHLNGLSDEAISRLTNEASISAKLTVVAPQAASVVDIAVSPGQRLEQAAPLVKLAHLSPLWAEIAIPASNVGSIRIGAKVEIEGYATPGRVILVSETTDAATQAILVRAEIPNSGALHPARRRPCVSAFSRPVKAPGKFPTAG